MAYELYIFPRDDSSGGFDVSEIAHGMQYTTSINGYPGKFSFILEKDPSGILALECGYAVAFRNEGRNVFYGYIFTIGTDRTDAYKVTAYDQMRYLQNHDYHIIESGKDTLDDVFNAICEHFSLKHEIIHGNSQIRLRPNVFIDVSGFDIIQSAIDEVAVGGYDESGHAGVESTLKGGSDDLVKTSFSAPFHFIRDRFGKIELDEIMANAGIRKLWQHGVDGQYIDNLPIIGDKSLLTDYEYELSIDKDTYNRIEFIENIGKSGTNGKQQKTFVGVSEDAATQKKWGVLKKIVTVRGSSNEEMFNKYKQLALESSNRISKSISIKAIGLEGLYAGDCFVLKLGKLNINEVFYVTSATHNYGADMHTMLLEVNQSPNLVEELKNYG